MRASCTGLRHGAWRDRRHVRRHLPAAAGALAEAEHHLVGLVEPETACVQRTPTALAVTVEELEAAQQRREHLADQGPTANLAVRVWTDLPVVVAVLTRFRCAPRIHAAPQRFRRRSNRSKPRRFPSPGPVT